MGILDRYRQSMKSLTAIAMASTFANASPSDFPRLDGAHAHCEMTVIFPDTQCAALYKEMNSEIRSWSTGGPSDGLYSIYEEETDDYIWSTRVTKNRKYTDDQIFEFTQEGLSCKVAAKSRSQSSSYYDYSVNYCNMWNVFEGIGGFEDLQTKECKWVPSDPVSTCAEY